MLPFWIGFNTQALIQFNSAWLESTAGLLTLFTLCASRRGPFGCRDCTLPLERVRSTNLDQDYYRCRHCGLIKLAPETRDHIPQNPESDSPPRVITLGSRRAASNKALSQTLH